MAASTILDSAVLSWWMWSSCSSAYLHWVQLRFSLISVYFYSSIRACAIDAVGKSDFFHSHYCCFYQWSFFVFCWAICPQTTLHLRMGVIVLLGCIAVKHGEECIACRNASVPLVSTVSSPLLHPWDSGRTIWTPDILGLLCASVTAL